MKIKMVTRVWDQRPNDNQNGEDSDRGRGLTFSFQLIFDEIAEAVRIIIV